MTKLENNFYLRQKSFENKSKHLDQTKLEETHQAFGHLALTRPRGAPWLRERVQIRRYYVIYAHFSCPVSGHVLRSVPSALRDHAGGSQPLCRKLLG